MASSSSSCGTFFSQCPGCMGTYQVYLAVRTTNMPDRSTPAVARGPAFLQCMSPTDAQDSRCNDGLVLCILQHENESFPPVQGRERAGRGTEQRIAYTFWREVGAKCKLCWASEGSSGKLHRGFYTRSLLPLGTSGLKKTELQGDVGESSKAKKLCPYHGILLQRSCTAALHVAKA